MSIAGRIGQFFLFIGLIGLVIFFATMQAGTPSLLYCFSGWALLILGGLMFWKNRSPQGGDARFASLRRLQNRRRKGERK